MSFTATITPDPAALIKALNARMPKMRAFATHGTGYDCRDAVRRIAFRSFSFKSQNTARFTTEGIKASARVTPAAPWTFIYTEPNQGAKSRRYLGLHEPGGTRRPWQGTHMATPSDTVKSGRPNIKPKRSASGRLTNSQRPKQLLDKTLRGKHVVFKTADGRPLKSQSGNVIVMARSGKKIMGKRGKKIFDPTPSLVYTFAKTAPLRSRFPVRRTIATLASGYFVARLNKELASFFRRRGADLVNA